MFCMGDIVHKSLRGPLDVLSGCPTGKKKGQGLMEAVLCFTTEFGGRGQDLFREVMHTRGSKAKCDGKEHSVLGKKKKKERKCD